MRNIIAIAALAALFAGCGGEKPTVEEGERALAEGDFKAAAKIFKAAVKEHPSSVPLHYNLGTAQALAGDASGAISSFREVLRFTPGDLDASEALAAALRKTGTADALSEAHELLEFVLPYREEAAARARALNSLALVEEALRRDDLALARLLDARASTPAYAPTLYNLGHLCAAKFRIPAAAAPLLDAFLASAPDDAEAAKRATALRDEAARAVPPPYSHRANEAAAGLIAQGGAAYAKKDFAQAEQLFAQAANADPLDFDAIFNRANALVSLNRKDEAAAAFQAAAAINPGHFDAAFWAARIAYSAGDYPRAISLLTTSVIPRWPDEPQPLLYAAYAYAQQRRYYEARLYGALHLAALKKATPKAKTADFEAWLAKLPDLKFKP